MCEFVFWQRIVSPHMMGLAKSLVKVGHRVTYIALDSISSDRVKQGWVQPEIGGVKLLIMKDISEYKSILTTLSKDCVHLTQGLRGNGYISEVIRQLILQEAKWGVIMETINDSSLLKYGKRLVYRWLLSRKSSRPDFVLSIGHSTEQWVADRGFPALRIFPFAYFLESLNLSAPQSEKNNAIFRFAFVGQLIPRKRVDLVIDALADMNSSEFEFIVIGQGCLEDSIREKCSKVLGKRGVFLGALPMTEVRAQMSSFDCLILPSDHDGWGAVASESLMAGTPVICSDHCGVAGVVKKSGYGGVFARGNLSALQRLMRLQLDKGCVSVSQRNTVFNWSACLGADAGANYLISIAQSIYEGYPEPVLPW